MAAADQTRLFQPLPLGPGHLQHRIAMAPLTRYRATPSHVPTPLMATHYAQRACVPGTLLIAEATYPSPRCGGYSHAPGIYTPEQAAAWRVVTDAVHARGGQIWLQLWALGRTAWPNPDERLNMRDEGFDYERGLVSASDVPMAEGYKAPRPLEEGEIWGFVGDFAEGARRAVVEGGFDGVEVHGAHGYLVDQFTQDTSNRRTDAWGGSIENRSRFAVEVCKAIAKAIGPERTGIRLSPWNTVQGMRMADPVPQFTYLIQQLSALNLAFLHLVEPRVHGVLDKDPPKEENLLFALRAWGTERPVLIAGGFTPERAVEAVEETYKEWNAVIVFGRRFISTPDLVYRIKKGIEWNAYSRKTFYVGPEQKAGRGLEVGYVDYPYSEEFVKECGERVVPAAKEAAPVQAKL